MKYACPCCGYYTFSQKPPDSHYHICAVCFWEDDPVQFNDPTYGGGANGKSLERARDSFARLGAARETMVHHTRAPHDDEIPPGHEEQAQWLRQLDRRDPYPETIETTIRCDESELHAYIEVLVTEAQSRTPFAGHAYIEAEGKNTGVALHGDERGLYITAVRVPWRYAGFHPVSWRNALEGLPEDYEILRARMVFSRPDARIGTAVFRILVTLYGCTAGTRLRITKRWG